MDELKKLPQLLLSWYYVNRRDLPWRADREPYHVWLSEIMLQQTRVEAVKGYYARFLAALPTIESLARCPDDALYKLWEGLGYYSRVRNLKKAAGVIMERHGGCFPKTYEEILALPGIGAYTAGAISSICYDLPTPAVDGNVLRVISRLTDDSTPIDLPAYKKSVEKALSGVYPAEAGDFTQALMELGATVCGPNRKPDCESCPCERICKGYLHGTAKSLPAKSGKKPRREENMTVFVLSCGGQYALEKRPDKGLLAGLWQFPHAPGHLEVAQAIETLEKLGIHVRQVYRQTEKNHIFTHIQWNMRCFYMEVRETAGPYVWMPEAEVETRAALPTAFRQFWEEHHV